MKSNTHKRRLIFTAFSRHLEGSDLYEAMIIWHTDFSSDIDTSFKNLVKEVCQSLDKVHKYNSIYWELIECQKLPIKELLPDPIKDMKQYITNMKNKDFAAHTFALLVVQIGKNIDKIQYLDTGRARQVLLDAQIGLKAADAIVQSMKDGKPRLIPKKAVSSYTLALNAIYVAICESVGPVKADKILSDSVAEVDNTKYGKSLSATTFL